MKEKRKLRIIYEYKSGENPKQVRTVTTYRKFKKRFPESVYFRTRINKEILKNTYDNQKFSERALTKPKAEREYKRQIQEQEEEQEEINYNKRIRKQVVINYRSDSEPYSVSIRAITLDPEMTERGLLMAVQEIQTQLDINFEYFSSRYAGFEQTEIPKDEDKRLNDMKIHIEVQIKKNPPINFTR